MIIKQREEPLLIKQLESLLKRLPPFHPIQEQVQFELTTEKKGYRGEKSVDYPLSFLPEHEHLILHNLRIPDQQNFFQMDTLLLNEKFFLILEIKNWDGIFQFDDNNQLIRLDTDKNVGYQNPITQVKLQRHRLQKWLHHHKIKNVPIEYLVVFSFPETIYQATNQTILSKVTHSHALNFKIEEIAKQYSTPLLKRQKLNQLSKKLIKAHTPKKINIIEKFKMNQNELIKGVICPNCNHSPMHRIYGKWECPSCHHTSKDAHRSALNDYFLLINDKITNQKAREFLQIDSPYVTKKLLQQAKYNSTGTTSSRVYQLNLI